jgi:putative ABC transport system permease protein
VEIMPIVSALKRNKGGALLVAAQIALTVAIVCNSLSVIQQQLAEMERASGLDEDNIFTMTNQWVGQPTDIMARTRGDLAALRALPGVVDAEAMNSFPLRGYGAAWNVTLKPGQRQPSAGRVAVYMVDAHGLRALGVRLTAGRWFRPDEIGVFRVTDFGKPFGPTVIVTQALAQALFPGENALGRVLYLDPSSPDPTVIVGIVQQAQTPWAANNIRGYGSDEALFLPYLWTSDTVAYLVRTQPGRLDGVLHSAQAALFALSSERIVDEVHTFAETREEMYRPDRALALTLGGLSILLMGVTGCGIVSLASNWVLRRRWQIGIRRALGARRADILRYFHTENLLIAGAGLIVGIIGALGLNLWVVTRLEVERMGVGLVCLSTIVVLLVSQLAVLWPALRAASVPPAIAARSI